MTVVVEKAEEAKEAKEAKEAEEAEATPAVGDVAPNDLARWHIRAAAIAIDVLPGLALVATMGLLVPAVPLQSTWWWVSVSVLAVALLLTMVNRIIMPPLTGWSLGRALVGNVVVLPAGEPAGPGRLLCREFAHLLDVASLFVWALWDPRRRTLADLVAGTEVRRVEPEQRPRGIRRLATDVVLSAALLCVAGAGLNLITVQLPDRASHQTSIAIKEKGPKLITELLSYDPKSQHDEFAHAQSLTTDRYRPTLAKQQDAVKGRAVVNEYWVTNNAVLSATPNSATMLLFMLGHRGSGNEQRFITATVKASFVKDSHGGWLVDDLNVVTKPKPPKDQK